MQLPARIGKYELQEFLGGGMSHVYRAKDTLIDRTVALKILTEAGNRDPEAKARFLHEARLAGKIDHDNIVNIFDYGVEGEQPYIVMEFVRGESLRDAIKNNHTGSLKNRLRIAHQIASALEYVHQNKIIHRDIKPDNIHLEPSGRVKLMDFGIAKSEGVQITKMGFTLGTPYYMAPEQILGQPVTPLVDIYAFGILLFELLSGRKPISQGGIEQIFHQILNEPLNPQPLREAGVPPAVEAMVMRCAAKDAGQRYPSFADVAADLLRCMNDTPTTMAPPPVQRPASPHPPPPATLGPRPTAAQPAPQQPAWQPAGPTAAAPPPRTPTPAPMPARVAPPPQGGAALPGPLGSLPAPLQTPQGLMLLTALIVILGLGAFYLLLTLLVR